MKSKGAQGRKAIPASSGKNKGAIKKNSHSNHANSDDDENFDKAAALHSSDDEEEEDDEVFNLAGDDEVLEFY